MRISWERSSKDFRLLKRHYSNAFKAYCNGRSTKGDIHYSSFKQALSNFNTRIAVARQLNEFETRLPAKAWNWAKHVGVVTPTRVTLMTDQALTMESTLVNAQGVSNRLVELGGLLQQARDERNEEKARELESLIDDGLATIRKMDARKRKDKKRP